MRLFFAYICLPLILSFKNGCAQGHRTDSLWNTYSNKNLADTVRLKAINTIAYSFCNTEPDTAIFFARTEMKFAKSLPSDKGKKWVARSLCAIATSLLAKSNYAEALEVYFEELALRVELKDRKGKGACLVNIGITYKALYNYPKALEYYLKGLKQVEEIGAKSLIATCYNNIGIVYQEQAELEKSLNYYFKALKIWDPTENREELGFCYSNIGIVYQDLADYEKALQWFIRSLEIRRAIGDQAGMGVCYLNIGTIYHYPSAYTNYPKALEYYFKSLKLTKEIDDRTGVVVCYVNLGDVYLKMGNYTLAIEYSDSCINLSKEIRDIDNERLAHDNLAKAYYQIGRYEEAYLNQVKFKQLTDSIFNVDNSRLLGDMKTQFEVEKREAELKVKSIAEREKLEAISLEEKKRQNVIIYSVAGVLVLVIVFSLFLLNRFRVIKLQKQIIERQKTEVDHAYDILHEKNKEVMDSIFYARRIQTALLPNERYINKNLERLRK